MLVKVKKAFYLERGNFILGIVPNCLRAVLPFFTMINHHHINSVHKFWVLEEEVKVIQRCKRSQMTSKFVCLPEQIDTSTGSTDNVMKTRLFYYP
mmetsp:Transcript_29018/g.42808  ORF Transcript_29018/g.42808 Transcript_29018/m.42808 type:complete len:95 (+) Transcript_29018:4129-4413(+)